MLDPPKAIPTIQKEVCVLNKQTKNIHDVEKNTKTVR